MGKSTQTNAGRIHDFHLKMGGLIPAEPGIPDLATLVVRRTLVDEEYAEVTAEFNDLFSAAVREEQPDVVPLVHELADLLYVTYGAIWACGVDPDPIFAEIHRANMEKADGPRRADGKVLKPKGWQPPDVRGVVERGGKRAKIEP